MTNEEKAKTVHEWILELLDKIKDLEDKYQQTKQKAQSWFGVDIIETKNRVTDLEAQATECLAASEDHNKRLKDLEDWKEAVRDSTPVGLIELQDKVRHIEEWKSKANGDMTDIYIELKDIKSDVTNYLVGRIEKLEEWKRDKENVAFPLDNVKVIDKKVWEDIKSHTIGIGNQLPIIIAERIESDYKALQDAIKKADPAFCTGDKD